MNPVASSKEVCDHVGLRNDVEKAILTHAGLRQENVTDSASLLRLVEATSEAVELCEKLQRSAIHQARRMDIPWSEIGAVMGITRQAVQQRFGPEQASHPLPKSVRLIPGATGFNEMQILEAEGKAGNHLVDFGPLYLTVMPSNEKWEHRRVLSLNMAGKRAQMEAAGWIYVGSWFPYHYFKRVVS
ncbi:MAG: hypothetical protein JW748_07670 [Anaerolineales bacterium]|nr:hypothetical protein [Anaerolineales bacterium]